MVKVRKGFTLVELLIVIVIIGILAAAMLLSMGSATDSATASKVITEIRGLKAAALMFYADSSDALAETTVNAALLAGGPAAVHNYLARYMDNPEKAGNTATSPFLFQAASDGKWYVGMDFAKNTEVTDGVKRKLTDKSKTTGLFNGGITAVPTALTDYYTSSGVAIWMVAR